MGEDLLRVEEVAVQIKRSVKTINSWYVFKKENPDNVTAKLLPDYVQSGSRQTRYWKSSDIPKFIAFRDALPIGKHGIMGSVTQRYIRRKDGET